MSRRLIVSPAAESDLDSAYRWYENQRSGLGETFMTCVEAVFHRLLTTPQLHPLVFQSVRQAMVRRFPYVVCHTDDGQLVKIIAVFHGHRDPTVWKSRVDE
jgi:plasmid stabilization system protein ParE